VSERQLFEAVRRRMRALAGRGASDLDDLVQIAAEQVFRGLDSFSGRSDLMTWVYSICYRVLLRHRAWYRRWQLRFSLELDAVSVASEEMSPPASLEAREGLLELHAALTKLSDKYRSVIVLHDLEQLSVKEIAKIVGAPEPTVRSRLRDGRKQLQRLMQASVEGHTNGGRHELEPS
jgi:RNA polymerase sigma-70 factor (ECF subfamily)